MKQKILASVLVLLLILPIALSSVVSATGEAAPEASNQATGTVVNGYAVAEGSTPVSTAAEFEAMTKNGVYHLTQDIDFGGKTYDGYILAEFSGTLNGCGYKIFNYTLTKTTAGDCGTIYRTCNSGETTIRNLQLGTAEKPIVMDVDIASGNLSAGVLAANQSLNYFRGVYENITVYTNMDLNVPKGTVNAGGIIGYVRSGNFIDCKVYGSMAATAENSTSYHNIGGIASSINSTGTYFLRCFNYADITVADGANDQRAVGIVAYSGNIISVLDCGNYGKLTAYKSGSTNKMLASGILGTAAVTGSNQIIISNCFNAGEVKSSNYAGSIVGLYNKDGILRIDNVTNYKTITREGANPYSATETALGYAAVDTAKLSIQNASENLTGTAPSPSDFAPSTETVTVNGYAVPADSIAISSAEELQALTATEWKSYHLTKDIDFGGAAFNHFVLSRFNGTLNGCGYAIYNFALNAPADGHTDTALIQRTGETAPTTIQNLIIGKENAPVKLTIDGTTNSKSHAILVGAAHANHLNTFENIKVYGDIVINSHVRMNVGMLAGYFGRVYAKNCATYGSIVGKATKADTYQNMAGLASNVAAYVQVIENCYNYANITAAVKTVENRAGGLISYTDSYSLTMRNCGNFGTLSCTTEDAAVNSQEYSAGGIIACVNPNNAAKLVVIENCFNAGEIASKVHAGAMVGRVNNAAGALKIVNCTNYKAVVHGLATPGGDELVMWGGAKSGVTAQVTVEGCKNDFTGKPPVVEEESTEEATTEAPTTEAPTTEAPTTEAPTTEAPTTEAPTTEAPTTEAPTTEAPSTEAPSTEAPSESAEAPSESAEAPSEKPTEKPEESSTNTPDEKGCKSSMMGLSVLFVSAIAGCAVVLKKKD